MSNTIDQVLFHYERANIPTISGRHNIGKVIKQYYENEYLTILKKKIDKRIPGDPGVIKFKSTLNLTMRFFRKTVLKDMAAEKKGKALHEQEAIDNDTFTMNSMMSDRIASYSGVDKLTSDTLIN